MAAKPFLHSWTLWFNVLSVAAIILGAIADSQLALGIPPQVGAWVAMGLAVVNACIRLLRTSQPLSIGSHVPSTGSSTEGGLSLVHPLDAAVPDAVPITPVVSDLPPTATGGGTHA
jgi:hypothetical protein